MSRKREILIDKKIADAASSVLSPLGLSLESAAQTFFAQCVYKRGLPFTICIPEGVSPIKVDCPEEPEEEETKKGKKLVSKAIDDNDPYRTFLRALMKRKEPLSLTVTNSQDGQYKNCHYQDCPTGKFGGWTILIMRTTLVKDYKNCSQKELDRAVLSLCGKTIDTYVVGLDPNTKTCLVKPGKVLDSSNFADAEAVNHAANENAAKEISNQAAQLEQKSDKAPATEGVPLPIKCPLCKAAVLETKDSYACANALNGCEFVVPKTICGHDVTKNELKMMAEGKKTRAMPVTGTDKCADAKFARFAFDLDTKSVVVTPVKKHLTGEESSPSKHDVIAQWRTEHPTGTRAQCEKDTGISKRKISKCWNSCNPRSCRSTSAPLLSDNERVKRWMVIHPEKGPKDCAAELTDVSYEAIREAFKIEGPSSEKVTSQVAKPKTKREMIREWIEANPEGTAADCKAAFPKMKEGTLYSYYSVLYREMMPKTAAARKEAAKANTKRQAIESWRNNHPEKGVKDCIAALPQISASTVKWYWYNFK
jgi:antitoxin component of RelBE/YafQ-DinJ toxin-antitoxin module